MSEDRELWKAVKEYRRQEKVENEILNKKILKEAGITYIEKPNGQVLIGDWNFWTSTGKGYNQKTKQKCYNLSQFLEFLTTTK